ncbi:MAG: hypothetical protein PVH88_00100 [Ignavibacteria bacterium]|jgi:hypothetical protein
MKFNLSNFKLLNPFLIFILFIGVTLLLTFCNKESVTEPWNTESPQQEQVFDKNNPAVQKVFSIQKKYTEEFMKNENIIGTATGLTEDGKLTLLVLSKEDISLDVLSKSKNPIPAVVDNIPVEVYYTGEIKALRAAPIDHQVIQTPPIELGTSGGWKYDLANGYCCGGTLGSLIQINTEKYILSNYHVLSADIVSGDNNRVAQIGDPIIQTGLIDVSCDSSQAQDVATLASVNVLPNANVDAAIAKIIPGMVDTTGAILEIGTLSSQTVAASIRQRVKKSGRTTGLTTSRVSGLNATVNVTYDDECAGSTAFTKTFTGQILIRNIGSSFLNSGDSGSLMVENVATNPRAVGLLYAGSSTIAVANPINDVLNYFGATMVGN